MTAINRRASNAETGILGLKRQKGDEEGATVDYQQRGGPEHKHEAIIIGFY